MFALKKNGERNRNRTLIFQFVKLLTYFLNDYNKKITQLILHRSGTKSEHQRAVLNSQSEKSALAEHVRLRGTIPPLTQQTIVTLNGVAYKRGSLIVIYHTSIYILWGDGVGYILRSLVRLSDHP